MSFSPDGSKVLCGISLGSMWGGHLDATAGVWDATSGNPHQYFAGHTRDPVLAQFFPDGSHVLTASTDQTLKLWNIASNYSMKTYNTGHISEVNSVTFSPEGSKILTGSYDDRARIWDVASGNLDKIFSGVVSQLGEDKMVAEYSPDGSKIFAGSFRDTIATLWDLSSGWIIHTFRISTGGWTSSWGGVSSVAISPDGSSVLTGIIPGIATHGACRPTTLWDMNTGSAIRSFYGGEYHYINHEIDEVYGGIGSVAYSPDGSKVLLGSLDAKARLYGINGDSIRVFSGHTLDVASVAFSPDGSKILTGSSDSTAKLWDVATGNVIKTFLGIKTKSLR